MQALLAFTLTCLLLKTQKTGASPLCYDNSIPISTKKAPEYEFCDHLNKSANGVCCTAKEEAARKQDFVDTVASATGKLSSKCTNYLVQIKCAPCDPWASYAYSELLPTNGIDDGLMLSEEFCENYVEACGEALDIPEDYCTLHTNGSQNVHNFPTEIEKGNVMKPTFPNIDLPDEISSLLFNPASNTWWILDQAGRVLEFDNDPDANKLTEIVSLETKVSTEANAGLRSVAIHPNFEQNGVFYLSYVHKKGKSIVSRFIMIAGDGEATAETESVLYKFSASDESNHGVWIGFPPNEISNPQITPHHLYISVPDRGNLAQDLSEPYGKILRVAITEENAVDTTGDVPLYTIPDDNVFGLIKESNANGDIFASGFHDPWKCSFDKITTQLYCIDSGVDRVEELDTVHNGANYGWGYYEGTRCNTDITKNACNLVYVAPVFQYCHLDFQLNPALKEKDVSAEICQNFEIFGEEIVGGFIYRGSQYASQLDGQYIFADNARKIVGRLSYDFQAVSFKGKVLIDERYGVGNVSSFAEDGEGELYMVSLNPSAIYKVPCPFCD